MYALGFCNNRKDKFEKPERIGKKELRVKMRDGLLPGSGVVMFYDFN